MPRVSPAGFMSAMTHDDLIKVLIELDGEARPIQGSIAVSGGDQARFHGWLELNDRLELALTSGSARADAPR